MRADELKCPHCGAEYDESTGELIPEKPKKKKATKKKPATKAPKKKAAPSKKKAGRASTKARASGKDKIDF